MRTSYAWLLTPLLLLALAPVSLAGTEAPPVVTLESPAALLQIKVMVKAGAGADPQGVEGLAYLTGRMLIEGGFGDPRKPVTKDELAEMTRPWGSGAYPHVDVGKESTTFSMTVPKEVLDTYVKQVLAPLFTQPLFVAKELDRLRAETLTLIRSGRLEQIELVGLMALDNYIYAGTGYAHPDLGTEKGLEQVTSEAVRRFYATYYTPENIVVGVSSTDPGIVEQVQAALQGVGQVNAAAFPRRTPEQAARVKGREVLIVALPNAIATGLHAGFPIPLTRADADYWPLYIANIWFGTHRDSFSHLYQVIRAARGYNYGDYSYIEHFEGRPSNLFPPPNSPRRYQYFSIWIRPVQHDYALHLLKALTWELENFIRTGLREEQCALAKNKARVLYLNLAETPNRLLGTRLDDAFYGLEPGYLDAYLEKIDAVRCPQVNAAIKKYLQADNLKYVIVTDDDVAPKLAAAIAAGGAAWGKSPADYQIDVKEENGQKVYLVPQAKLDLLRRDAAWAYYWLDIPRKRIRIVPADKMFKTAALPE
ncbi:MAG: M16 family metallopeptidase [Terriglobia bacterium]